MCIQVVLRGHCFVSVLATVWRCHVLSLLHPALAIYRHCHFAIFWLCPYYAWLCVALANMLLVQSNELIFEPWGHSKHGLQSGCFTTGRQEGGDCSSACCPAFPPNPDIFPPHHRGHDLFPPQLGRHKQSCPLPAEKPSSLHEHA